MMPWYTKLTCSRVRFAGTSSYRPSEQIRDERLGSTRDLFDSLKMTQPTEQAALLLSSTESEQLDIVKILQAIRCWTSTILIRLLLMTSGLTDCTCTIYCDSSTSFIYSCMHGHLGMTSNVPGRSMHFMWYCMCSKLWHLCHA